MGQVIHVKFKFLSFVKLKKFREYENLCTYTKAALNLNSANIGISCQRFNFWRDLEICIVNWDLKVCDRKRTPYKDRILIKRKVTSGFSGLGSSYNVKKQKICKNSINASLERIFKMPIEKYSYVHTI